jgi:RNA-directed DNA polymerase
MLVEALYKQSGVSISKLEWLAATASKRYKVYNIPKRSGGTRTIEHPSRALKAIQRWISRSLFEKFPVHDCATAYRRGANIRSNAAHHRDTKFTLRIDFSDFFPSFHLPNVFNFLSQMNETFALDLTLRDIKFISLIVTRNGRLTIGAPSSPILTNAMMYEFDRDVANFAQQENMKYTRYADDVFISTSTSKVLSSAYQFVDRICRQYEFADLQINQNKTVYLSCRYRRSITGLVITPDRKISIGRKRKREIRALIHQSRMGNLEEDRLSYLRGLLAFAVDAEPELIGALSAKYGNQTVQNILSGQH